VAQIESMYKVAVDVRKLKFFQIMVEPLILTFDVEMSTQTFTMIVTLHADVDFTGLAIVLTLKRLQHFLGRMVYMLCTSSSLSSLIPLLVTNKQLFWQTLVNPNRVKLM